MRAICRHDELPSAAATSERGEIAAICTDGVIGSFELATIEGNGFEQPMP